MFLNVSTATKEIPCNNLFASIKACLIFVASPGERQSRQTAIVRRTSTGDDWPYEPMLLSKEMGLMTITIVNGYVCTDASEVAKARAGQDPYPQTDTSQSGSSDRNPIKANNATTGSKPTDRTAVVYGGRLASGDAGKSINQTSSSTLADTPQAKSNINTLA
jgi:hypothetical protein